MSKKTITKEMVDYIYEFLGEDGRKFFAENLRDHGDVAPCLVVEGLSPSSPHFPHPVHFREGMQIRNALRKSGLCEGWDDHDYDNNYQEVLQRAIMIFYSQGGTHVGDVL